MWFTNKNNKFSKVHIDLIVLIKTATAGGIKEKYPEATKEQFKL